LTSARKSCWCGATSPPSSDAPTHTPYSCATFSSRVIASTSASTLDATGSAASRHAGTMDVSVLTFAVPIP
jgi:hypothetical protein